MNSVTNKLGNVVGLPFDSFDESGILDLGYSAEDMRVVNTTFWQDGFVRLPNASQNGYVVWTSGLALKMNAFRALIDGIICFNGSIDLEVDAGVTLDRIDSVVIIRDLMQRKVDVVVKRGTAAANPKPPELNYTLDGLAELLVANIYVRKNATSISQVEITDMRKFLKPVGINALGVCTVKSNGDFLSSQGVLECLKIDIGVYELSIDTLEKPTSSTATLISDLGFIKCEIDSINRAITVSTYNFEGEPADFDFNCVIY